MKCREKAKERKRKVRQRSEKGVRLSPGHRGFSG